MLLGSSLLESHPDGTGNLNGIVNGNWTVINEAMSIASGKTASQSTGTVTSSAAVFTSDHVGCTIRWADGHTATITAFTDSQHVTASPSQTVSAQSFEFYRTDQTAYTLLARGLLKKTRFLTGDDGKIAQWDQANSVFVLASRPGFGVTVNEILFGGGTGTDMTSSASFTWDGTTLTVGGGAHFSGTIYNDITAVSAGAGTTSLDFATSNVFNVTLTGNATLDATNIKTGGRYTLVVRQDATGGRTLALAAKFKLVNSSAVSVISAGAANAVGVFYVTAISGSELVTST